MNKQLKVIAVAVGATFALSAAVATYAAEMGMKKGDPVSVSESAPDKAGKDNKGKAGVPTMPSKGPASVSESAPDKTGKEPKSAAKGKDDNTMANPKTPANVSESRPDQAAKDAEKNSPRKKGMDKDRMPK